MSFINLSSAFAQWQELATGIPKDDTAMLAESWNDCTDSLCKDGKLCALQYHHAPAYDEEMPGDGSRFDELSDDREFILDAMGITMSAQFVPFSQSRNKHNDSPSLNWRITLAKDGRDILTTDYMQGSGHCPAYKSPITFASGKRDEYSTRKAIAAECEAGRPANSRRPIPAPELADVFHCLLSDSSVLDCRGFADWCDEIGFNSDSIKHRAIYDACMETALKLRAAFGDKTMSDLRELFEDM